MAADFTRGHGPVKVIFTSPDSPPVSRLETVLARQRGLAAIAQIDGLQRRGGFSQYMRVKR